MRKINDIKPSMPFPENSVTTSTTSLDRKWVLALFKKLEAIYPGRFQSSYQTSEKLELAINEWSAGLAGFSPEEIRRGLAWCRDNSEWVPTIAEFRRVSRPDINDWQHKSAAYREHRPERLLRSDEQVMRSDKAHSQFRKEMQKLGIIHEDD